MATEIKKIISRRDTAAKWEANNPILAQGEIGVDTTNKEMKIGDGVTPWKSLKGVGGTEIVNDLTTGGADKALSAEMGKELEGKLSELVQEVGFVQKGVYNDGDVLFDAKTIRGSKVLIEFRQVVEGSGAVAAFNDSGTRIGLLMSSGELTIGEDCAYVSVVWGSINILNDIDLGYSNKELLIISSYARKGVDDLYKNLSTPNYASMEMTAMDGFNYLDSYGLVKATSSTYKVFTAKIEPNEYYKICGWGYQGNCFYSIQDANGNVLEKKVINDTHVVKCDEIVSPKGAYIINVSGSSSGTVFLGILSGHNFVIKDELKRNTEVIEQLSEPNYVEAEKILMDGYKYIDSSGVVKDTSDTYRVAYSMIEPQKSYRVGGFGYKGNCSYSVVDVTGQVLLKNILNATNTLEYDEFKAPDEAYKIYVSESNTGLAKVYVSEGYKVTLKDDVEQLMSMVEDIVEIRYTGVTLDVLDGYKYIAPNGVVKDTTNTYKVGVAIIEPNKHYKVGGWGYQGNCSYSVVDNSGNILLKKILEKSNTVEYDEFQAPENAYKINVATNIKGHGSLEVQDGYQASQPSSDGKKWASEKWVVVGDSLTEFNSRATKNYHHYISEHTGISVNNMGSSGTGYAKKQDEGLAFYQRAENIPTDASVITIFGSGNDMSSGLQLGEITDTGTDTLCGCVNTTIDIIQSRFPLVPFGIITPTPWIGSEPNDSSSGMRLYSDKIEEICKRRGVPCLNLYYCSNLHPSNAEFRNLAYSRDDGNGVHPDENGHKIIAPRIEAFLDTLLFH